MLSRRPPAWVPGSRRLSPSGDVTITAGTVEIEGTRGNISILTDAIGDRPGGTITIKATEGGLHLHGAGAVISAGATSGSGDAGPITINAKNIVIEDGARIGAGTSSAGKGGDVTVTGNTLRLTNGKITSTTDGSGKGGQIVVRLLDEIVMSNRGVISAETFGDAGSVTSSAAFR